MPDALRALTAPNCLPSSTQLDVKTEPGRSQPSRCRGRTSNAKYPDTVARPQTGLRPLPSPPMAIILFYEIYRQPSALSSFLTFLLFATSSNNAQRGLLRPRTLIHRVAATYVITPKLAAPARDCFPIREALSNWPERSALTATPPFGL